MDEAPAGCASSAVSRPAPHIPCTNRSRRALHLGVSVLEPHAGTTTRVRASYRRHSRDTGSASRLYRCSFARLAITTYISAAALMNDIRMSAGGVIACILADTAAFSVGFVPSLHKKAFAQARPQGLSSAQPRRASRLGSAPVSWRASAATPQFAPPGGLPSSYAWEKQWYPIFLEEFQADEDPFPFTLLGQQVVFWKDKVAGEWRCMADRCPHRLVPLSEGRVLDNGEIECPYHGWTFQGNTGECTSIPHAPDQSWSQPRACGTALSVSVKQGIVWVWPENLFNPPMFGEVRAKPDESLIPTMDVLDEHKDAVMDDVFRDIPYDWSTYVENVLDVSHVTFTHHGTQGKREATKPFYFLELAPVTEIGFELESVGPDRQPTGQGRNTKYVAPTYLHHTINFGAFLVYVATMAVPTKPGWCRIIGRFPVINAPEKLQKASKKIPTFMKHLKRLQVPLKLQFLRPPLLSLSHHEQFRGFDYHKHLC